jgi:hypothetical protein
VVSTDSIPPLTCAATTKSREETTAATAKPSTPPTPFAAPVNSTIDPLIIPLLHTGAAEPSSTSVQRRSAVNRPMHKEHFHVLSVTFHFPFLHPFSFFFLFFLLFFIIFEGGERTTRKEKFLFFVASSLCDRSSSKHGMEWNVM